MDFFNKSLTQLSDLFRSMTPGARVTAGLLLAVLVVSLVWLVGQKGAGPDDYLLGGQAFSAAEINAMELAFGQAGLDGYTLEGNKIRVPRGQRAAFMGAIADGGALPADFGAALRKTLEDGGPFITAREREERLKAATQEELALWIREMPGIEKAAVAYDVKTTGGLTKQTLATASVSVKPVGTAPLEETRIRGIRHMVASAISEMKPENVVVTDLNTGIPHKSAGPVGGVDDDTLLALGRSYEEKWRTDIERQLAFVPGARISVAVILNPELERIGKEVAFRKADSATTKSVESQVDESRESTGPGGVPGTRSNTSASNTPQQIETKSGSTSTAAKSSTEQVIAPGGLQSTYKQLGLQPKRVTVAVSIPRSYFEKLWRKRNNAAEDQKADPNQLAALEADEVQKIRILVASLLPIPPAEDPIKPVAVEIFDDFEVAEIPATSTATGVLAWLGNYWSTLGMVGLGLFALVMLRSTVRAGAAAEPAQAALASAVPAAPAVEADRPPEAAAEPAAKKARMLKRRESGLSLRDELAELIREDPDGAAAILRSWIGHAV